MTVHVMFDNMNAISVGGVPYPGMDINKEFVKTLQEGYRMGKPTYAPENV